MSYRPIISNIPNNDSKPSLDKNNNPQPTLRNKTFTHHTVCKAALVWRCPSQLLSNTKKAHPHHVCRLDHDPYYRVQFHEAVKKYINIRHRSEPDWDPDHILIEGDPWGYMFDTLLLLENEIEHIESQRSQHYTRSDLYREFIIDDDNYNNILREIRNLYYQLDLSVMESNQHKRSWYNVWYDVTNKNYNNSNTTTTNNTTTTTGTTNDNDNNTNNNNNNDNSKNDYSSISTNTNSSHLLTSFANVLSNDDDEIVFPPALEHFEALHSKIQHAETQMLQLLQELMLAQAAVMLKYYTKRNDVEDEFIQCVTKLYQRFIESDNNKNNNNNNTNDNLNQNDNHTFQIPLEESSLVEIIAKMPLKPPQIVDLNHLVQFDPSQLFNITQITKISSLDELSSMGRENNIFYDELKSLDYRIVKALGTLKTQICETCCGIFNLQDDFVRLREHICGRVHHAYCDIRLQIQHYTRKVKPLLSTLINTSPNNTNFEHQQHLIHPWQTWAASYVPLTQVEIKQEQERVEIYQVAANTIQLLNHLVVKKTIHNNTTGDEFIKKNMSDNNNNNNNTSHTNGQRAMNDDDGGDTNGSNNISMNNTNSDNDDYNDVDSDSDDYLLDPCMVLALESIDPFAPTLFVQDKEEDKRKLLLQQQQGLQPLVNYNTNLNDTLNDYHMSERDAFKRPNQRNRDNYYDGDHKRDHGDHRDRDRNYRNNNTSNYDRRY